MTNTKRTRLSLTSYRGITVGVATHGNPVRRDPVPAVLPSMWSTLPRFPRSISAVSVTVLTS